VKLAPVSLGSEADKKKNPLSDNSDKPEAIRTFLAFLDNFLLPSF
jgi:hypothetical protein